jgi:hypothetical protein
MEAPVLKTTTLAVAITGLLISAASADNPVMRQADPQKCKTVTIKPNDKTTPVQVGPILINIKSGAETTTIVQCKNAR